MIKFIAKLGTLLIVSSVMFSGVTFAANPLNMIRPLDGGTVYTNANHDNLGAVARPWDILYVNSIPGLSGPFDLNGEKLTIDLDGDTWLLGDTDDQIDIAISNADDFQFTANTFTALAGSAISSTTFNTLSGGDTITFAGLGGAANDESFTFDFETVANEIGVSSASGVTHFDFGTIGFKMTDFVDETGGQIFHMLQTPTVPTDNDFILIEALGTNWTGGQMIKLRVQDNSVIPFEINSGSGFSFRILRTGDIQTSGNLNFITDGLLTSGVNDDFIIRPGAGGKFEIDGPTIITRDTVQTLNAGDTITVATSFVNVQGNGNVTLTGTPTFDTTNLDDGEVIEVECRDDAGVVTFQDEATLSNTDLQLEGDLSFNCGLGDQIKLRWNEADGYLWETWRADN